MEILKEGGNAVDAAVAAGFALAVVHPIAGNIGGGGFMLLRMHTDEHAGRNIFIDYREKAPLAATANMYLDAKGNVIPDASIVGFRAIGYARFSGRPGLRRAANTASLGLQQVMAPAIRLASQRIRPHRGRGRGAA